MLQKKKKMTNEQIGSRLRKLRLENGYPQRIIAELLCVSRAGYSQYESGKRKLTADMLIRLADFYGVSVDSLLNHEIHDQEAPPADSEQAGNS